MKKAFLTGSSSGIGAEFKQHLLSLGFDVTAPLRSELDLSNLIVVPNCVLPVGCGEFTTCVSVKTFIPNSANVTYSAAVNDNFILDIDSIKIRDNFENGKVNLAHLIQVPVGKMIVLKQQGDTNLYPIEVLKRLDNINSSFSFKQRICKSAILPL